MTINPFFTIDPNGGVPFRSHLVLGWGRETPLDSKDKPTPSTKPAASGTARKVVVEKSPPSKVQKPNRSLAGLREVMGNRQG